MQSIIESQLPPQQGDDAALPPGLVLLDLASNHPAVRQWADPDGGVLARIEQHIVRCGAHKARTVVLLPYAQLLRQARYMWALRHPDGFAPRFETSMNWSHSLRPFVPEAFDLHFDAGPDAVIAQNLLQKVAHASQQSALAGLLMESAYALAPLAASNPPGQRSVWAEQARSACMAGLDLTLMDWEAKASRVAVEWAANSAYATDVLFEVSSQAQVDCLIVLQGLNTDPLTAGLKKIWGDKLICMPLVVELASPDNIHPPLIALHACAHVFDESERTTACVIEHLAQGRFPLALVSADRALTRRVRAALDEAGVAVRDENGWKLSTMHAAAQVMALLRAQSWSASTDSVLAWLKEAPAMAATLDQLEALLRRLGAGEWAQVDAALARFEVSQRTDKSHFSEGVDSDAWLELKATLQTINAIRTSFKAERSLTHWLSLLAQTLQSCAMAQGLLNDEAGVQVLLALQYAVGDRFNGEAAERTQDKNSEPLVLNDAPWMQVRMNASEFTAWVTQCLEAGNFVPAYPLREQVVILPLSQLITRPFAALVLAGCDAVQLPSSPEPLGPFTSSQRKALGLGLREDAQNSLQLAWAQAIANPYTDVLWRLSSTQGEPLLPSPLVQLMAIELGLSFSVDRRLDRTIQAKPVLQPKPQAANLPVSQLSQSGYEDLRHCPYRFFAMRQLGLHEADELNSEIDKRDFGTWLHAVLARFHQGLPTMAMRSNRPSDLAQLFDDKERIDQCAQQVTHEMGLGQDEFLPFQASWPALRDGYLKWSQAHQKTATFTHAEWPRDLPLGAIHLRGRIDRLDTLANSQIMVLDYKTENKSKTKARIKEPFEDTQMAFYAALIDADEVVGGYVSISEREGTELLEQENISEVRDALVLGIITDMQKISQGHAMPAMGEGSACDYCKARGLCRKDFWSTL